MLAGACAQSWFGANPRTVSILHVLLDELVNRAARLQGEQRFVDGGGQSRIVLADGDTILLARGDFLSNLGIRIRHGDVVLGDRKVEIDFRDFPELIKTPEGRDRLLDYCRQDVALTLNLWNRFAGILI